MLHPIDTIHAFPNYAEKVEATTHDGQVGIWQHGQYGWYPAGKWGIEEYPHTHIATWQRISDAAIESHA
jgi:hypothetical protein